MDPVEALKKLGGKATSKELLELLAPELGPLGARKAIADAVREGKIKKIPDRERKVEVFVL
ncbi:MAG: hypothetical protein GXO07_01515 [Crenarchaeota archaeon]|nr:hypothetical protein [Thermoproteota archaeon]